MNKTMTFVLTAVLLCGGAFAQTMTVDGVALDAEERAALSQAKQEQARDMATLEQRVKALLQFLQVEAAPVIETQAEQAKVDAVVVVVRALARRLWEAKAGTLVNGVTVKRKSLESKANAAQDTLDNLLSAESPQAARDTATAARDAAQTALDIFNAAHP